MAKNKTVAIIILLLLFLALSFQTVAAAAAPTVQAAAAEISDVRFAVHTDAQTGEKKLRLVLEVTGPVQASATLGWPSAPQLIVDVQGATAGKIAGYQALDGNIATILSVSTVGEAACRMIINLPQIIDNSNYKVSVLPGDPTINKPYRVVLDIDKPVLPATISYTSGLKGKIIAIDPGHGGTDSGAIGPSGIQEKTVTLAVALAVKGLLEQAGAKVIMTRTDDRDVFAPNDGAVEELGARVMVGNQNKADIFLDIHANSFSNPSVGGIGTYYYQKSFYDKLLAQSLQSSAANSSGLQNRGVYSANFYVLKHTTMPAALIELAFLSNPDEEQLLNTPQFQQQLAQGIVSGLDRFFGQAAKLGGAST